MTGKILVVDPVATNRIVLKAKLSAAFYDVDSAATADQALGAAQADLPDLILMADRIDHAGTAALCAALRQSPRTQDVPVLVLSDAAPGPARAACLRTGADDLLDRTVGDGAIFARIRTLLRDAAARRDLADRLAPSVYEAAAQIPWDQKARGTIGWVSDRRSRALGYQAKLAAVFGTRATLLDPATILGRAPRALCPDLYVIEQDLDRHGSGLELLSDLSARRHSQAAGALVLVDAPEDIATAYDLGASGVHLGPVITEELAARMVALLRRKFQRDRLRAALDLGLAQAVEDPLTKLQNRRSAMEALAEMAATGRPSALMMIDIDHFKSVNDRLGHAAGDAALVAVARQLQHSFASAQILGRIGGEEFLVGLPGITAEAACGLADRARHAIAQLNIRLPDRAGTLSVTASLGVTMWTPDVSMDEALGRADAALYSAKRGGRNCVRLFEALPA